MILLTVYFSSFSEFPRKEKMDNKVTTVAGFALLALFALPLLTDAYGKSHRPCRDLVEFNNT